MGAYRGLVGARCAGFGAGRECIIPSADDARHECCANGTCRQLTRQGLETPTPMIKVGDTVMLGAHDELLGSEMVLERTSEMLAPLSPPDGGRPSGASSTSTRRITFTPARRTTHQVPAPEVEEEDMPLAWQTPV